MKQFAIHTKSFVLRPRYFVMRTFCSFQVKKSEKTNRRKQIIKYLYHKKRNDRQQVRQ